MNLENDKTISHYKILSAIGAGGMGEVYLAQDTKLDRKVAIKFLNEEFSKDSDKLNRFIQEAKAASALNHPNILTVYEIGETDDTNYIVTEFIEGKTLREHISPKESLSLNTILKIGVQVSEALPAAHQAGIIHRDIKPENVMIRSDGYAKVLDFGLAKLTEKKKKDEVSLEGATKAFVKTNPGMVMGTVSYMSPEQARGKETNARTDIWSLGVVLYEMLAGKVPFTGETVNHTIVSILEKEPLLLENAPNELQRIVRKTLTKDVEMRYQTAHDLLIDLKNLRRDLDIQGELERSAIPNRKETVESGKEKETQIYNQAAIEKTQADKETFPTKNVTTASSLEYAITQAKSHRLVSAIIAIVLLGAISAITYFGFFAKSNAKQIESIAVMPFVNESGNADVEYLSDGMTETLISSLSQIPKLNVKARSSVFRYKGKETDAQTIGRELNVQAILNGRVVQRGQDLILYVELVDAATENVLWKQTYNKTMTNLVALQTDIARDVADKLKVKLSGADEQKLAKNYTENTEAYKLYLQGRFYRNKSTGENNRKAIELFNQAIAIDPNYALAYAGIADAYPLLSFAQPQPVMLKAREAALKALLLDNNLAEAHVALSRVLLDYDYDFAAAERELKTAVEVNPNYAGTHTRYGLLLTRLGRHEEAFAKHRLALEIEPLSLLNNRDYGESLILARRYNEAMTQLKKTLELDANFLAAHVSLGFVYQMTDNYAESVEERAKVRELQGNPQIAIQIRESFAKGGWEGFLRDQIEDRQLSNPSAYIVGTFHAALGEKDKAFAELNRSYENREYFMTLLKVDPRLDPLRDDSRFQEMLKRMNLPE